jgi:hypothetical protein
MAGQACLTLAAGNLGVNDYPIAHAEAADISAYFNDLSGAVAA